MTRIPSLPLSQSAPPTHANSTSQDALKPRVALAPQPRLSPRVDMAKVDSAPSPRKGLSPEPSPRVVPSPTTLERIASFKPREPGKPQRPYRSPRKGTAGSLGAEKEKPRRREQKSPRREQKSPRIAAESKNPPTAPEAMASTAPPEIKWVGVGDRIRFFQELSSPELTGQAHGRPNRRPLPTIPSTNEIEVTVSTPEKKSGTSDILS
jgi:hypothetical protein